LKPDRRLYINPKFQLSTRNLQLKHLYSEELLLHKIIFQESSLGKWLCFLLKYFLCMHIQE